MGGDFMGKYSLSCTPEGVHSSLDIILKYKCLLKREWDFREIYQPKAMCGSYLDPASHKPTIKKEYVCDTFGGIWTLTAYLMVIKGLFSFLGTMMALWQCFQKGLLF